MSSSRFAPVQVMMLHLVAADHLGQRQAQLGGAHGARQGHHHLAAAVMMRLVAFGRIDERGRVEMAVVVLDEGGDFIEVLEI